MTAVSIPYALKASFLQYEQVLWTKNFRQYLETILISSKDLRMVIQKTPYQRTYEMQVGSHDYNAEWAAGLIKSIEFSNISQTCSATNSKKLNTLIDTQNFLLYKQFVVWHWKSCTINPLTEYTKKTVFQELADEEEHFCDKSDERIYIDLRDSLGYKNEIQKPSRNDSKLTMTINIKNALARKKDLGFGVDEMMSTFICWLTKTWP